MLQNADGLPATPADVPADYPLRISWPGILVDDPGHAEDIVGRVREALAVIWPATHDAIEQEACEILGVDDLRAYFANANKFFADHLKRYSKSRRSAPIYWPLSTQSGSYTLWLYYHRLSDQMLYTCVNDFVDPKLAECRRGIDALHGRQRSTDQERELERLTELEAELQEFRAELLRIARFWRPNLNDGVQITAAPLWRLFRHRAWQKRLQETWEKLEQGDYDWAHLAMSIWPERVVPKCLDDRSLAIAHDVEDLFWVEEDGKWRKLQALEAEIARQKARAQALLNAKTLARAQQALADLAAGPARGVAAAQVAQHLAEGDWDDTHVQRESLRFDEVALLFWPERVAQACLDDPFLADKLRLNLPAKRTQAARKRFVKQLNDAGCPHLAQALLDTLAPSGDEEDAALETILADLHAGKRDAAPLALAFRPEEVIDRALDDEDLAAAHDLRRFFWVQTPDGGWRRRVDPKQEVVDEVRRRQ